MTHINIIIHYPMTHINIVIHTLYHTITSIGQPTLRIYCFLQHLRGRSGFPWYDRPEPPKFKIDSANKVHHAEK